MTKTIASVVRPEWQRLAAQMRDTLVPLVNEFRTRQTPTGSVDSPCDADIAALTRISDLAAGYFRTLGRDDQAAALEADVRDWVARGLGEKPYFDRSRDAFRRVEDGEATLFVGVTRATNSTTPSGVRLELFFVQRHQPDLLAVVEEQYPHAHDVHMDVVLLAGSEGFALGNCLVFFPESVAALEKIERQHWAVFFFSKFHEIHGTIAVENAELMLAPGHSLTSSAALDPYLCYQVRSLWGYLHDRAHFSGPWSMADNAVLKMHWFVGVLEEIKVDVKLILLARDGEVPYIDELFAMIILERVFRYPLEPRPERNFDAGTGFFIFSYLLDNAAMWIDESGRIQVDQEKAITALGYLVDEIEALEARSTTPDEYRANATQMVRRYLAESDEPKDKYRIGADQALLRTHAATFAARPALDFAELVGV